MVSLLWESRCKSRLSEHGWLICFCHFLSERFIQQVGLVTAMPLAAYTISFAFGQLFPSLPITITVHFANYTLTRIFLNCFPEVQLERLIRYVCVVLSGWVEHWTNGPSKYLAWRREDWVSRLWFTLSGRLGFGSEKHKCYHKWGWEGSESDFIVECYCLSLHT